MPALICCVGFVLVSVHGYRNAGAFFVALELTASGPGIAQLYFDRGRGFSEADSVSTAYRGTGEPEVLRFSARRGRYFGLRFDPAQNPGEFILSNAAVLDRAGAMVRRFPPAGMRPHQQIAEWSVQEGSVALKTLPRAADPVILLSESPFALRPDALTVLRYAWARYLAVVLGAILLHFALKRFGARISALLSDDRACVAASAMLPLVVYADVLFLGRTMTFDGITNASSGPSASTPVADPLAGTAQDHPWLNYIGRSLRQGELPLVNLQNGLGAPLLESLQSGVFYPPNLLLPLFNLEGPWFFGAFMVLHVVLLWAAVTLLLRLYLPVAPAAVLAAAFTLSPITFSAVNMVHYRAFVWVPVVAWAMVSLARGRIEPRVVAIGVASIVLSFTAGSPQETVLGLLACALLFTVEAISRGKPPLKPALFCAAMMCAGVLLALPSLLPYFEARAAGVVASVEGPSRALFSNHLRWLAAWIVPAFQGVSPHLFQSSSAHDEFSTFSFAPMVLFLIIVALFSIHRWRVLAALLGAILLGMLKVFGFGPLDALALSLPFFDSVRYTKYVNYLHLTGVVLAAMALAHALDMEPGRRKRVLLAASAGLCVLIAIAGVQAALSPAWQLSAAALKVTVWIWLGAALSVIVLLVALLRHESKTRWFTLAILVGMSALLMRPYGFPRSVDQVPPLLDAPGWTEEQHRGRILARGFANVNLLRHYESIGVFDPVLNAAFVRFMTENFDVYYPHMWPQPKAERALSDAEVAALRLLGVTSIVDYPVASSAAAKITDRWWRIERPLPRVFLVDNDTAQDATDACGGRNYTAALRRIEEGLIARVATLDKGVNQIAFTLDRGGQGTLVALQAYTPAWRLAGAAPLQFCRVFPSWRGSFKSGHPYVIEYRPLGLARGLWLALVGALLAAVACILAARYRQASTSPKGDSTVCPS